MAEFKMKMDAKIGAFREELRGSVAAARREAKEDISKLRGKITAQMETFANDHKESVKMLQEMERALTNMSDKVTSLEISY